MSIGETILSLKHQEDAVDVLIEIAQGARMNNGRRRNMRMHEMQDAARTFLIDAGISWKKAPAAGEGDLQRPAAGLGSEPVGDSAHR